MRGRRIGLKGSGFCSLQSHPRASGGFFDSERAIRTNQSFGKEEFFRCSDVDFEVALEIFRVPGYELRGVCFRVGPYQEVREYSFYSFSPLLQKCGVDLSSPLGYFQAAGKVGFDSVDGKESLDTSLL